MDDRNKVNRSFQLGTQADQLGHRLGYGVKIMKSGSIVNKLLSFQDRIRKSLIFLSGG
jgi:hypothetical protein